MGTNLVAGQKQKPKFSVAIHTDMYQKLINNTLGDPERAKRFVAAITSAVAVNPALQDCNVGTVLAGALLGESLNLSPSPQLGQYYLVPRKVAVKGADGKKVWKTDEKGQKIKDEKGHWVPESETVATFQIGYKGLLTMAIRTGQYADIDVMEIRQGEYKGKDSRTGKPMFQFVEDDDEREALPIIGYMAYFEFVNGFRKTLYWSRAKMMSHADKYSPAFEAKMYDDVINHRVPESDMWKYSSFWYSSFDDMAKKTMLRQLLTKWGLLSVEMQSAVSKDDTVSEVENNDIVTVDTEDIIPAVEVVQPEYNGAVGQVDLDSL